MAKYAQGKYVVKIQSMKQKSQHTEAVGNVHNFATIFGVVQWAYEAVKIL